jgi:O-antigen/teichoic acid export membrane protein
MRHTVGGGQVDCDTRPVPRDAMVEAVPPRPTSGEHERHLAISAIAQQISQVVATLSMLAAITVLARRLSLAEFGTYGLLISLASYMLFVQRSVETAAVKAVAESADQPARDRAFSSAVTLYLLAGLVVGGAIASGGTAVLGLFGIPAGLHHEAQMGVFALAAVTAVGWPFKVFQDVLRGGQLFVASAAAEGVAFLFVGALLVGLVLADMSLWLLVAVGASVPVAIGVTSAVVVRVRRLPFRFRRDAVTPASIRAFLGISGYLFLAGIADVVIYSLDRAVLAMFRSAAAVGLYEGPVRAHGFVQQVHTTLVTPVVPASASYLAQGDDQRARDLLLRGTRYTLAAVVPIAIVLMILAKPILKVWLGAKYGVAATAMTILVGYWLVNGSTGVAGRMLIAAGRVRTIALYAGSVALVNLTLSLALTPSMGLNGVVLGTTIAYVLASPFFLWIVVAAFPVRLSELVREVWLPAYLTGAAVATGLLVARLTVPLDTVPRVFGAGLLTVLAYWAIYYLVWLRPAERVLVTDLVRASIRR